MEVNEKAINDAASEFNGDTETASNDDDWSDVDLSDALKTLNDDADGDAGSPDGDHTEKTDAEKPEEVEDNPEEKAEEDQPLTLKYMGEVKTVSREEAVTLAQKGMDYDRIKSRLDEKEKVESEYSAEMEFMTSLAKEQGLSLSEFVDNTKAAILARKEDIPTEQALSRIKLERREAELARKESELAQKAKEVEQAKTDEASEKAKRDKDISEFRAEYKDVVFDSIPKEVWADVAKGKSLLDAYARYENKILREKLGTAEKNKDNAAKALGSKKTAGSSSTKSKWLDGWED